MPKETTERDVAEAIRNPIALIRDGDGELAPPVIKSFDFSVWHPLDHSLWSPRCLTFFGGRPHHFQLWMDYKRPRPLQALKCRLGLHDWAEYWQGREMVPAGQMCRHCWIQDGPD